MLIESLTYYLVFVIIASLAAGLLVWRIKLPASRIIIPLIFAVILLPAPAVYVYATYFSSIPEVVVPNLAGQPLEQAFKVIEELGLSSRHAGQVFDTNYAEGQVVSQRPEAGRKVKLGRTVFLVTSSGSRHVSVPNLLGRPLGQAEAVLSAKGLLLGQVNQDYVPELDPGIILTQSPLPGEDTVVPGSVSVTVSATAEAQETAETATDESVPKQEPEQGGFRLW
jgi:beta-lactam-binding protein with PASTA domain